MTTSVEQDQIRESVREKYAASARRVTESATGPFCDEVPATACCGASPEAPCCGPTGGTDPVTANLYAADEIATVPTAAIQASLGYGNPTALARLNPGETVLDLGSGGGIDVLLSARRVGPTGFACDLDMTDEMLALAERHKAAAGVENVAFQKGEIEDVPLPDNSVDVVISNCVINLSSDKGRVLSEAIRVLKPGGRFVVSDVASQGELPADLRADMEAWVGCVAGALEAQEYRRLLADAGFTDVDLEVTRVYDPRELATSIGADGGCCGGVSPTWDQSAFARFDASGGRVVSAFARGRKP